MLNKPIKTSLVIRKCKLNHNEVYSDTPLRSSKDKDTEKQTLTNIKFWQGYRVELNSQYIAGRSAKWDIRFGKQFDFNIILNIYPYDSAILHP